VLDRLAIVNAPLDKGASVVIGDMRVTTGIPRPVHVSHEVAENRVRSARKHEHELRQVSG